MHGEGRFSVEMLTSKPIKALMQETSRILLSGLDGAITASTSATLKARLVDDVRLFSGFKTINEMEEAKGLLLDTKGNIKPFDTFLRDIRKIDNTYNANYLRAEYDLTIASAQMAEQWNSLEEEDLIQHRTAGDEKVRASHRILDGITLPKSDSYWDGGFPPLGYGCRCTAVAVSKRKNKPSDSDKAFDLLNKSFEEQGKSSEIFRYNPGKEELIFPSRHPYYKAGDKEEVSKLLSDE